LNGVGTVDADYPNEIGILLINHGKGVWGYKRGDRIAQGVVTLAFRIDGVKVKDDKRIGGFGSTGA
jgi:dUTP pyrophosphatase